MSSNEPAEIVPLSPKSQWSPDRPSSSRNVSTMGQHQETTLSLQSPNGSSRSGSFDHELSNSSPSERARTQASPSNPNGHSEMGRLPDKPADVLTTDQLLLIHEVLFGSIVAMMAGAMDSCAYAKGPRALMMPLKLSMIVDILSAAVLLSSRRAKMAEWNPRLRTISFTLTAFAFVMFVVAVLGV
ncbi:hypothetical protein FRB99_008505 [Tulasnella sp. 403]|nr:hypothetical protein FRB99_008505 [Tulasnella sp. 403]